MTAIQENNSFDVFDDIFDKYNNTVHKTIKMKSIEVTNDYYAEYSKISGKKNPKFKVGDNLRISKYKNISAKGYTPNWPEEPFFINKIKSTFPWTYAISDLNGEEITGSFFEKELQNLNVKEFKIKKILKRKDDKLYVKWKGHNNSFNSWIHKNDLI